MLIVVAEHGGIFAGIGEAERGPPGTADRCPYAIVDQPRECDLRIIRRTFKRAVIGVVAKRCFEIEFAYQRQVQIVSEDRDIDLCKARPDIVGL